MSFYEHTVITRQDLTQNQQNKLLEKYQEIIKKSSGKIVKLEKWGLLNFSHKIKKNKKGMYFHFKFEGDGKLVNELETAERIDNSLIRFLTVKVKKFDLETKYFESKEQ
tara:strand:+ start:34 stop:360 length:327 start_codon:yes stop_codon:yes gene_type:complete